MRDELVRAAKMTLASFVIALLCSFCVYKFFPQYLCYVVYNVNESQLYEKEDMQIAAGSQYIEMFTPTDNYIKAIAFNLKGCTDKAVIDKVIEGELRDAEGKVLAKERHTIQESESDVYCSFQFERWVTPGELYQFVITFPDSEVCATFGPGDIGPAEHMRLLCNQEETEKNLYLRYVYGQYSKKLLMIWFLAFFVCAYLLGELLVKRIEEWKKHEVG